MPPYLNNSLNFGFGYLLYTQVGKSGHLKNIHVPNAVLRMNFPALVDIYDVMVNLLNQQEKSVTLNHHTLKTWSRMAVEHGFFPT